AGSCEVEVNGRGTNDNGTRRSATELRGTCPAAGFEPATSRVLGEVALVFTTGRKVYCAGDGARATLVLIRSGNMRSRLEDLRLLPFGLRSSRVFLTPPPGVLGVGGRGG